jgi:hypothetical protein
VRPPLRSLPLPLLPSARADALARIRSKRVIGFAALVRLIPRVFREALAADFGSFFFSSSPRRCLFGGIGFSKSSGLLLLGGMSSLSVCFGLGVAIQFAVDQE